jgi:hypothetical protein
MPTKCARHVDDGAHMEDAGFTPFHGPFGDGASGDGHPHDARSPKRGARAGFRRADMEPGNRMLRLVDDLDARLRALCGVIDAHDAQDIRELATLLAAAAREESDCERIGLDGTDLDADAFEAAFEDGLLDEIEISSVTERAEELVAFCRLAIESSAEPREPEPGSDEA